MSDSKNKLEIIYVRWTGKNACAVVVAEQAIQQWQVFRSSRTGTEYRITNRAIYLGDMELLLNPDYPKLLCDYYKSHKDFATNVKMQEICKNMRGFGHGPIRFAQIGISPVSEYTDMWNYVDAPEKMDIEVGDNLICIDT